MADDKIPVPTQADIDANPILKAKQVIGLRMKDLIKDMTAEEIGILLSAVISRRDELAAAPTS